MSAWIRPGSRYPDGRAADAPARPSDPDGDHRAVLALAGNADHWVRIKGRVGPGGVATLHFLVQGTVVAEGGNLPVAFRVHAVGYAASDDIPARMDLMESRSLCTA